VGVLADGGPELRSVFDAHDERSAGERAEVDAHDVGGMP
jgi:hypothetical protein